MSEKPKRSKVDFKNVRAEAGHLIREHRTTLSFGLVLMVVNRLAGLALPAMPKFLIDNVIAQQRPDLLWKLVAVGAAATVIQAATSYTLSQVVSVAAQGAIAKMRKEVQAHVLRLPVGYFDSTKTGVLISRIMTDPEGIRNLVGTGLVQLIGGLLTAIIAFGILLRLNMNLTLGMVGLLGLFASAMAFAFKRLRPIFRERGAINAEVTGRLTEALGGVRLVKTYVAEEREAAVFGAGVDKLFKNIASTITGTFRIGRDRYGHRRSDRGDGPLGGRPLDPGWWHDHRRAVQLCPLRGCDGGSADSDLGHRHPDHGSLRWARPHPRAARGAHRGRRGRATPGGPPN